MRNVAGLILAAGGSTRFGQPKQFLQWRGESLIRRMARSVTEAGCSACAMVVGEAGERVAAEVSETNSVIVSNPDWSRGLGTSIRIGMKHLLGANTQPNAVVLLACDQPFVETSLIATLIQRWERSGRAIVASRYADTLGIPALFDRSCFDALLALPDDSGAKGIIQARLSETEEAPFEAGAFDIDTPSDYERVKEKIKTSP